MTTARIELPPKLIPVFIGPALVRGAFGGRGSSKTRSFGLMTAVEGYRRAEAGQEGLILGLREWMNSLDESSMSEIKHAIASKEWLSDYYEVGERFIRSRNRRIEYDFMGVRRNLQSIKSRARILIAWADEAEPITAADYDTIDPTLREHNSELWVTWNPERRKSGSWERFVERYDPVTKQYVKVNNPDYKIVKLNYQDNPFFPEILERKRIAMLRENPDQYAHVWEGEFRTVVEGAYFTQGLNLAKAQNRITQVPVNPLHETKVFVDIGGTGQNADFFEMGACQFVGKTMRWHNHYAAQGQEVGAHLAWLRQNDLTPGRASIWLPHDGVKSDSVYSVTYESVFRSAGYTVEVVKNQGKGAAMKRVQAVRNMFPAMWFDAEKCAGMLESLGWYHPKIDKDRGIDLGPEHDFSSHCCDLVGMAAMVYDEPDDAPEIRERYRRDDDENRGTSWESA